MVTLHIESLPKIPTDPHKIKFGTWFTAEFLTRDSPRYLYIRSVLGILLFDPETMRLIRSFSPDELPQLHDVRYDVSWKEAPLLEMRWLW